jgi:uncharacterized protein (DUF1810 family)
VKGWGEQVPPAQTPKDRALGTSENPSEEDGRARVVGEVGTAGYLVKCTYSYSAARQPRVYFLDAKGDGLRPHARALDSRNPGSQIFKGNGVEHGISRLLNGLIRSAFVPQRPFESTGPRMDAIPEYASVPRRLWNSGFEINFGGPLQQMGRYVFAMTDPHDLDRFVSAQAGSYETALAEIRRGAKRSHWMWYIFPQIAGLGRSEMAQRFAIQSIDEAQAYLDHPLLGARLRECVSALQNLTEGTARDVFGDVDAVKLRSSLTLFHEVAGDTLFARAIERWCDGRLDPATLNILRGLGDNRSTQTPGADS